MNDPRFSNNFIEKRGLLYPKAFVRNAFGVRNRKIFRRIKRPPSQRTGNEMAVGIFIMVLDFCITGVRSPGGKIPPKPHPSGSAPVRCSGAKPGSGKGPGHSPLQFQSDCRSQRWTGRRRGCWKRASSSGP